MNIATSTILACVVVLAGNCRARAIQGLARNWADTKSCPWEVRSFCYDSIGGDW